MFRTLADRTFSSTQFSVENTFSSTSKYVNFIFLCVFKICFAIYKNTIYTFKKGRGLGSDKVQSSKRANVRPEIHQIKSRLLDLWRLKGFVAKFLHLSLQFLTHVMAPGEGTKTKQNQTLQPSEPKQSPPKPRPGQPGEVLQRRKRASFLSQKDEDY